VPIGQDLVSPHSDALPARKPLTACASYGLPIDQELVSKHSYALWRDPKTRLCIDYTGLDVDPYDTCWKSYSVTRQERGQHISVLYKNAIQ
jgi:hypothetical protein